MNTPETVTMPNANQNPQLDAELAQLENAAEESPAAGQNAPAEDTTEAVASSEDAQQAAEPEADFAPDAEALSVETTVEGGFFPTKQAASVGKLLAGGAIASTGVAMLILPGPGVAAIAVGGLIAAKGASELSGVENPVIAKIEQHPEYQAAAKTAKEAGNTVANAVGDAAKQVPGIVTGAGKAVVDAVGENLPKGVRDAAEVAAPVVKGAAEIAVPVVELAGKGMMAGFRALGDIAGSVVKRK